MSDNQNNQENNQNNQNNQNNLEPILQLQQICIYCMYPLLQDEETTIYTGNSPLYQDWICHLSCNEIYNSK